MAYLCLLLSGAVLLVNGLATLNRLPWRDAAILNLVVGSIQLLLGLMSLPGGAAPLLTVAGMFLFGLTYVYVGLDALLLLGSKGLGWFCGMVAGLGLLLAVAWLGSDPLLAVLWLAWAVLWGSLFGSLALGRKRMDPFIGWALVLASPATATVPAFLGLAGNWPAGPEPAWAAAIVVAGLFCTAHGLARRGASAPHRANPLPPGPGAGRATVS
ncbi:AmiS/UreI transporter [Pseudarthrobacter chlorophenolicus A6]|uniref:AmiS/UreI transporter n=1 Tax=Pseudarthrobacter chlorophenolicus (strain ATCC 700700 / DSM 12829 / CIP 107037 / JCM 12360 / KCTC 9906 / NCIMB 13794 / A6) TaxID=452863 RepID=B8H6K8_PSECP|nr:AmiS/UreI family transporter [Pseudarthrobacter chlorophenolicus]ACL41534.1 AmiS/UreI transporter [Pseudarthrobacter chlorophenolicus A6]SDQ62512.1 AmiS/UreI family transporter [Pseudarthrobacter chlorophenolicus]